MLKFKFINGLAMRGRLHAANKIAVYDSNVCTTYLLCGMVPETQEHILFQCQYSKLILTQIKLWMNLDIAAEDLRKLVRWIDNRR